MKLFILIIFAFIAIFALLSLLNYFLEKNIVKNHNKMINTLNSIRVKSILLNKVPFDMLHDKGVLLSNEYYDNICNNLVKIFNNNNKIECNFDEESFILQFIVTYDVNTLILKIPFIENNVIPINNIEFSLLNDYNVISGGNLNMNEFANNIHFYLQV